MQLLYGPPERQHPRNVALMMFTENPEKYFAYPRVEIVHFPNGEAADNFIEIPNISGPVDQMINRTLEYLRINVLRQKTTKVKGQAESLKVWNYPYQAMEEVIANALYHRDYQTREPVEIRVYPDKLIILNYGGPDRSIKLNEFQKGNVFPRRYRNRRLGDFLKELDLTEGKATGIPTIRKVMEINGSLMPEFITDEERSFFQVNMLIHPWFLEDMGKGSKVDIISHTISHTIPHTIGLSEKQSEVLSIIQAEPRISIRKMAERLGLNNSTVVEHIDSLKEKGVLERIGKTRGYWKINVKE